MIFNPKSEIRNPKSAFTLFELLAVLTVIGIGLAVLVGSYGSWGTAHALTGAARTVEAGLAHARTLAMTQRAYVAFSYGSTNALNAPLSATTGFQPFLLQPTNATVSVEQVLPAAFTQLSSTLAEIPSGLLDITPLAPFQRLSGHVRLMRRESASGTSPTVSESQIIFRPDGSIMLEPFLPTGDPCHYVVLQTTEAFPVPGQTDTAPLVRLFRIDPATGLATLIGGTP